MAIKKCPHLSRVYCRSKLFELSSFCNVLSLEGVLSNINYSMMWFQGKHVPLQVLWYSSHPFLELLHFELGELRLCALYFLVDFLFWWWYGLRAWFLVNVFASSSSLCFSSFWTPTFRPRGSYKTTFVSMSVCQLSVFFQK